VPQRHDPPVVSGCCSLLCLPLFAPSPQLFRAFLFAFLRGTFGDAVHFKDIGLAGGLQVGVREAESDRRMRPSRQILCKERKARVRHVVSMNRYRGEEQT